MTLDTQWDETEHASLPLIDRGKLIRVPMARASAPVRDPGHYSSKKWTGTGYTQQGLARSRDLLGGMGVALYTFLPSRGERVGSLRSTM